MKPIKHTVEIVNGKLGYVLKVNQMYIKAVFHKNGNIDLKAIDTKYLPDAATQWASISAIREFWTKNRGYIVKATENPNNYIFI